MCMHSICAVYVCICVCMCVFMHTNTHQQIYNQPDKVGVLELQALKRGLKCMYVCMYVCVCTYTQAHT